MPESRDSSAVEQLFRKQQVVGSNPILGSNIILPECSRHPGTGTKNLKEADSDVCISSAQVVIIIFASDLPQIKVN